ncbi:MAG: sodium:alanine symporter family protein, partial [Clostridia bacterium]|nr:sodium:alanine symporter family protein [Clostridia bacterium]
DACVPTMAIVYMIGCVILLCTHAEDGWPAICRIFDSAYSNQAAAAGFIGSPIMRAKQNGVRRGLFSNEAGMGSSPIISAPARTDNPVQQALVASTGPFWDTVVICTLTGLTLTTTIMAVPEVTSDSGDLLTYHSFATIGTLGSALLTISLAAFVVSTVLGWSYFGEKALQYLGGARLMER